PIPERGNAILANGWWRAQNADDTRQCATAQRPGGTAPRTEVLMRTGSAVLARSDMQVPEPPIPLSGKSRRAAGNQVAFTATCAQLVSVQLTLPARDSRHENCD